MKRITIAVLFLSGLILPPQLSAQHHDHHHLRNEIGFSTGAIYSPDHRVWGAGAHLHYYWMLSDHSKWSLGAMAEYAWVHGTHFTVGAGVKYQPLPRLGIGLLPGVTFLSHDDHDYEEGHEDGGAHDRKALLSAHIELVYDLFHWDKFHLGPVLDYSWSKDDAHFMLGIHGALCF